MYTIVILTLGFDNCSPVTIQFGYVKRKIKKLMYRIQSCGDQNEWSPENFNIKN